MEAISPEDNDEATAFRRLQADFADQYRRVFSDPLEPRAVLVIPSLSLDNSVLARISGVHHYEERMLCLLMLLRLPRTRVIYVTSQPISDEIVDYYLHLLPGVPHRHARERLSLLSCHDSTPKPLSEKILDRPRLLTRIGDALGPRDRAHMVCFNVSNLERRLSVALDTPVYGCDPDLLPLGSKSGGRTLFRKAGILLPPGAENLRDAADIAGALTEIKRDHPETERAVVKLNEGFSGEGNAIFSFQGAPEKAGLQTWIADRLSELKFESADMGWDTFQGKVEEMGAVAEGFVEGAQKSSPSVQFRVDPLGELQLISTHDQVLGGAESQVFLGCRFPADERYRASVQQEGEKVARLLRDEGVLGRFGIDFISVCEGGMWRHYAIEINLRKGGTTHPYTMMQMLTDGHYDPQSGLFRTADDHVRYYYATDNLERDRYKGMTPDELIDFSVRRQLHFHGARQRGIVFHLIGALSQFGKIGALCVGESPKEAEELYKNLVEMLDEESVRQ